MKTAEETVNKNKLLEYLNRAINACKKNNDTSGEIAYIDISIGLMSGDFDNKILELLEEE